MKRPSPPVQISAAVRWIARRCLRSRSRPVTGQADRRAQHDPGEHRHIVIPGDLCPALRAAPPPLIELLDIRGKALEQGFAPELIEAITQQLSLGNGARQGARLGVVDDRTCGEIETETQDAASTIAMGAASVDVVARLGDAEASAAPICTGHRTSPSAL